MPAQSSRSSPAPSAPMIRRSFGRVGATARAAAAPGSTPSRATSTRGSPTSRMNRRTARPGAPSASARSIAARAARCSAWAPASTANGGS
jgi:hypothetical protein